MGLIDDWELEQRAFHAAGKGVDTTATPEQMQELIRDLWKALCQRTDELRETEEHAEVLMEALAEIKATHDGNSAQPIGDILDGCIAEIAQIKQASPGRAKARREMSPFDKEGDVSHVGTQPGG